MDGWQSMLLAALTPVVGGIIEVIRRIWARLEKCQEEHTGAAVKISELNGKLARVGATAAGLKKERGTLRKEVAGLREQFRKAGEECSRDPSGRCPLWQPGGAPHQHP